MVVPSSGAEMISTSPPTFVTRVLHIGEAVAYSFIGFFEVKAEAVIMHFQQYPIRGGPQVDSHFFRIGMLGDIGQGFLADME